MRVCLALLIVLIAAATPAVAQTSPRFDVASVRPSPPSQTGDTSIGVRITRSQVQITSLTMKDYLAMAFNVAAKQIAGPDWLGEARFDITAKMPDGATRDELSSMLQALLTERFQMKIRREPREFPVYALTLAKGPSRLTPSTLKEPDADAPIEIGGSGSNAGVSYNHLRCPPRAARLHRHRVDAAHADRELISHAFDLSSALSKIHFCGPFGSESAQQPSIEIDIFNITNVSARVTPSFGTTLRKPT